MKILIPTQLRKIIGSEELESNAATVHGLLLELCENYNGLYERLYDKKNELNKFINFFVNDEDIRFLKGENTKLKKDDIVSIVPAVSGG